MKVLRAVVALFLLATPVLAASPPGAVSRSQLLIDLNRYFPNNNQNKITPADARAYLTEVVNSLLASLSNLADTQSVSAALAGLGIQGLATLTPHAVVIGAASGAVASIPLPANQILVGQASADPVAAPLTLPLLYTGTAIAVNTFTATTPGVVPLSGGGTTNFLRADGTWATLAGGGNVTGPGSSVNNDLACFDGTSGTLLKDCTIASTNVATLTGTQTLTNTTIKTANVTAVTGAVAPASADCGKTYSLAGSAQYAFTLVAASGYSAGCVFTVQDNDNGLNSTTLRGKTMAINGYASFVLWPTQRVTFVNMGSFWQFTPPPRWILAGDTTWFVNHTSGSGSADGLATGASAFNTCQTAVNVIGATVDPAGHKVFIQFAAESFVENACLIRGRLNGSSLGNDSQDYILLGDPVTPTNITWTTTGPEALLSDSASVQINGFTIVCGGSGANGIFVEKGGFLHWFNMNFGACTGIQIVAAEGGHAYYDGGSYSITGGGSFHWYCQGTGEILMGPSVAINISGGLNFTGAFVGGVGNCFLAFANGATFTGAGAGAGTTAQKYSFQGPSSLNQSTAGATLPGTCTSPCAVNNGAQVY